MRRMNSRLSTSISMSRATAELSSLNPHPMICSQYAVLVDSPSGEAGQMHASSSLVTCVRHFLAWLPTQPEARRHLARVVADDPGVASEDRLTYADVTQCQATALDPVLLAQTRAAHDQLIDLDDDEDEVA